MAWTKVLVSLVVVLAVADSVDPYCSVKSNPDEELLLVQTVWRHGDRSPTETYKTDPYQEDHWPQGWGQLSPLGMQQHYDLGTKLRQRYIMEPQTGILSKTYNAREMYVRSTDVNRTIISAMSNMVAFYPGTKEDYPQINGWPTNYVPIAVHTINDDFDYVLNPDRVCPRYDALWKIVETTDEYKKMQNDEKDLFDLLTKNSGQVITPTNLWIIADTVFIEKLYKLKMPDWLTDDVFNRVNTSNDVVEYWNNGLKLAPKDNIDFSIEIPKVRGGGLLWSIIDTMTMKWNAVQANDTTSFYGRLKYYVYSAHDTTLAALFSALGFHKTNWNMDGYPHYSSCVAVELWRNKKTNKNSVKFVYYPLGSECEDVTPEVSNLDPSHSLDSLIQRSQPYKPSPDPATLCNTLPNQIVTTSASPAKSSTPSPSLGNSFGVAVSSALMLVFALFVLV